MTEEHKTLKERLFDLLSDNEQHLSEIYEEMPHDKPTTIRGRLNENVGKCFKRIARGVYLAQNGDAQALIIEGDAWEKCKDFEDDAFDAIISDSPYTILNEQMQVGTTRQRNRDKGWSFETKDMDLELFRELLRILKPNGHLFTFLPADRADTYDYNHAHKKTAEEAGFTFNARWIWDKCVISLGYNGRPRHEQILFFSKGKRRMPLDRAVPDVLAHKRIPPKRKMHQTEKPLELLEAMVRFCTEPDEVILDPFGGSCVTAQAAINQGRNAVCVEIDGDMARKAAERLKATLIER